MAQAGPILSGRFPPAARWIREEMPLVPYHSGVWAAFLKWSQLPDSIAHRIVRADSLPHVGVTANNKVNGSFNPKEPRVIWLSEKLLDEFCESPHDRGRILLLESTIMHELVHWGNYVTRFSLDARPMRKKRRSDGKRASGYTNYRGQLVEVGKQFEREAYGIDVNIKNRDMAVRTNCGTCGV